MSSLKVENHGLVTVFTIANEAKRNAISQATAVDLQRAFAQFHDSDQRVAVVTGQGDEAFTAGADLQSIPEFWRCTPGAGITTDKPIIAAVAGWCIGGGVTLLAMCDLAVAADNVKICYPEAKLGFTQGLIAGLVARVPPKVAMEIMLLGQTVNAQRAYEIGLVNQVVPKGKQVEVAIELADRIATRCAPLMVQAIKRFVGQILPAGPAELSARHLQQVEILRDSADSKEGLLAFKEKRGPRFEGR